MRQMILLLFLLVLTSVAQAAVPWRASLPAALEEAGRTHKLIYLEFTSPG